MPDHSNLHGSETLSRKVNSSIASLICSRQRVNDASEAIANIFYLIDKEVASPENVRHYVRYGEELLRFMVESIQEL